MKLVKMISFVLLLSTIIIIFANAEDCIIQTYPHGTVCVCNATYCDTVPALNVTSGDYQLYSTSKSRLGFYSKIGVFTSNTTVAANVINVKYSIRYQTIIGFGGAFTDSTGINIKLLPADAQEKLLQSYFSESGIEYSLCRVPIGGTDFSTKGYSYDDVPDDITLTHFALQPEDDDYKIPFIQKAKYLTNNKLKLFASAWSAPTWMKTNNDWPGTGFLLEQYYQLYADYLIKFFDEYEKNNIQFWGMTTQNEPIDGFMPKFLEKINAMGWTMEQMNKWIGENLGPTLKNSSHRDIKIILHDDTRLTLPLLTTLLDNNITMRYAEGVAVHWYWNFLIPPSSLNVIKSNLRDVFVLASEASNGYLAFLGLDSSVVKGSWERGESYIKDIFENLEYGVSGWVDWNMALDETGGPTYIDNRVDAPVLVNGTLQEFYKQPMFYALGHFSKFIIPGSIRLETVVSSSASGLQAMAFLRPDNLTALVIYNSGSSNLRIQIEDINFRTAVVDIESNSINTLLYDYNSHTSRGTFRTELIWTYFFISITIISFLESFLSF